LCGIEIEKSKECKYSRYDRGKLVFLLPLWRMLLVFDDKHKEDLDFLKTTDVSIVSEFCKIAVNFIKAGANKKLFAGAARMCCLALSPLVSSLSLSFSLVSLSFFSTETKIVFCRGSGCGCADS